MEVVGTIWNEAIIRPMVNGLVILYVLLFGNLGLSILVFTALTRLATFPLTVKQLRSTRGVGRCAKGSRGKRDRCMLNPLSWRSRQLVR